MGGTWFLQYADASQAKVHKILFTGKTLSSEESYELGLINRLASDAKVEAQNLAKEVAKQHPLAI